MTDYFNLRNATEELKRADHLVFVSLKYTRTVDVIKSIIERLINTFDFAMNELLLHLKENGKFEEVPTSPIQKVELLRTSYPENTLILEFMDFYLLLRKINRSKWGKSMEFRRNVTMTVYLENDIEINIDIISEYFEKAKEFLNLVQETVGK